jgi:hypothetical protein
MFKIAKYYVDLCKFSVIPLLPGTKKSPLSWKEYQNTRANRELLEYWFLDNDYHIGIVTGKISGIVVVDLDSEEGKKRFFSLDLKASPTVLTGKGLHIYFKHPMNREIGNFQRRPDLEGIDLRGDGGYVVAPPSLHPNGTKYRWKKGFSPIDLAVADFPLDKFFSNNYNPIKPLYQGVSKGGRNNSLARMCGSWFRDGLDYEEVLEMALIWNTRNDPPLSDKELENTVRSIHRLHLRSQV